MNKRLRFLVGCGCSNGRIGRYRKAIAPCPRCKSWNTTVENGIFYCADCDFEGG